MIPVTIACKTAGLWYSAVVIRTHVISCKLPRARADALNLESGRVYTGVLVAHWRTVRKKNLWLSEKSGTRWSDMRATPTMHAHTIDVAQQGYYKACDTTRELRKAGFTEARFPHWTKKFRTTIWKSTGIKRNGDVLELSSGGRAKKEREERKISLPIPMALRDALRFLEVRLVYDKKARRYFLAHRRGERQATQAVARRQRSIRGPWRDPSRRRRG